MIEAVHTFVYDIKIDNMGRATETTIKLWLELDMEEGELITIPKEFEVFVGDESLVNDEWKFMPKLLQRWVENELSGMSPDDFGLEYADFVEEVFH